MSLLFFYFFLLKWRLSLSRDISRHKAFINFLSAASERADDFVHDRLPAILLNCQDHAIKKLPYGRKTIFKKRRFFVRKAPTWWRHKAMNTSLDQLFIWPKAWSQQLSFMAWVDFCPNVFGFESINSTNSHDFGSKSVYPSCWCTFSATIFWILGAQKTTFPKFPKLENLVTVYLDTE